MLSSGAIHSSGLGRVIFALSAERLYQTMEDPDRGLRHSLTCREALSFGTRQVEVIGPLPAPGAEVGHAGFWAAVA